MTDNFINYPLYNINKLPNSLLIILISAIWFPSIFSNLLPFNTEIFPWGIFAIFFLRISQHMFLFIFGILSLLYNSSTAFDFTFFDYFRSIGPIFNVLLIYGLIREINVEKKINIIKGSIFIVLSLNYLILFLEFFNLDQFTYNFFPGRADELGSINFSYDNRFNLLTPEPSRASIHLFSLGLVSSLVFKRNHFLIINFFVDLFFVRSLLGISLWTAYFSIYKFRYLIFFILLIPLALKFNFFDFDPRAHSLISSLLSFDSKIFVDIIYHSGHRLVSIMMAYDLLSTNPLGFGFVDNSKLFQEHYQNNSDYYNQYLEEIQMQRMFYEGKANLISFFFNILFALGALGLLFIFGILYTVFKNFKKVNYKYKVAIIVSLIFGLILIDKGVTDHWVMIAYIKVFYNKRLASDFS